jgi:hypothetical protein
MSVQVRAETSSVAEFTLPFVIRGKLIEGDEYVRNGNGFVLRMPDPARALNTYLATDARDTTDLYDLTIDEIVAFLAELGRRLDPDRNPYLAAAYELSVLTSRLPERVLRTIYTEQLRYFFRSDILLHAVDRRIGRRYLDGWVREHGPDGRRIRIRAYGARTVHVIAGNTPGVAGVTVTRNALTRSDALIKTPSNDPLTAVALARTMIDIDPFHPITKHLSVLHWPGGDERVEKRVFSNANIDKIVAWGGADAINNAAHYVGPGVELIALDPKSSVSLLGRSALDAGEGAREGARRLARDVGMYNQEGCVNSRVVYVETAGVSDPRRGLRQLAEGVYQEIQNLPAGYSAPVEHLPGQLRDELDAVELLGDPELIGHADGNGGVLISSDSRPVDFVERLGSRYVNLVPVRRFDEVLQGLKSAVQTVGVWPPSLKKRLLHPLALAGAQRIVLLGAATNPFGNQSIPQDGIEVLRRMCRWIVSEDEPGEPADDPSWAGGVHEPNDNVRRMSDLHA